MKAGGMQPWSSSDERALRECLARVAPERFGGPAAIVEIRRSPCDGNTSYDTYRITVKTGSGVEIPLFMKDFGSSVRPKDDPKGRREREVSVYRDLLGTAGLGTARYYGSVMDEAEARLWLLLEYVDGTPVGYCEPGDCWQPAAEALGRAHGYFAPHVNRLRGCGFLIRHHADFFWSTAEHATADVARVAPGLAGRLGALVRRYSPVVAVMTDQPLTLVHGGCRPSNILIRVASDPSRVCVLDWEEAGLGAPLFDLAYLVDGIASPLLDRLMEAYREGAATYGMSLPALEEMKRVVDCFRLHMAFNLLARAALKGYKKSDVAKVLDYAEGVAGAVFGSARAASAPAPPGQVGYKDVSPPGEAPPASGRDDSFRMAIERLVSKAHGRSVTIDGWGREASPVAVAGVFPVEVLRLSLRGETELALFVKQLGAEQADHPDKRCRDREPRLYEDLLGDEGLPVPRHYGSRRNEETGRLELYLEHVNDWSLKYQPLEHWFTAASRLAQLHVHFAPRAGELRSREYLLRLDAAYFHAWAARALAVVGQDAPQLARELEAVLGGYGRVAETLAAQPATLVHNDLAPKNVIADRSRVPARICFVDWEMAAVGCALMDLSHLKHGLDPASDEAMREAYFAQLEGTCLHPRGEAEMSRLLAACDLHHTLYRLAHSHTWRLPPGRVAQWVSEARDLARLL